MKKRKDLDEFLRQLEEAVDDMLDEIDIDMPIFIDVSIYLCPFMAFNPEKPGIQHRKLPVDILETKKNIHAVIGLQGMKKENIELSCNGMVLEITASNAGKTLKERIELPARVIKKGMKAVFKEGILEVVFIKSRASGKK